MLRYHLIVGSVSQPSCDFQRDEFENQPTGTSKGFCVAVPRLV